ncbi:MAG: cytochrome c [Sulfitobacter sp.]
MTIRPVIASALCAVVLAACNFAPLGQSAEVKRGQLIYAKECSQCHGPTAEGGGPASLGLAIAPPDLTVLTERNDGIFPREFVRRFVMGLLEKDDPSGAMPEFAKVGLRHVYPNGGADGEVLEADFEDMLDYLESIQK